MNILKSVLRLVLYSIPLFFIMLMYIPILAEVADTLHQNNIISYSQLLVLLHMAYIISGFSAVVLMLISFLLNINYSKLGWMFIFFVIFFGYSALIINTALETF